MDHRKRLSHKGLAFVSSFPMEILDTSLLFSDNLILPPIKLTLENVGETKISINHNVAVR